MMTIGEAIFVSFIGYIVLYCTPPHKMCGGNVCTYRDYVTNYKGLFEKLERVHTSAVEQCTLKGAANLLRAENG